MAVINARTGISAVIEAVGGGKDAFGGDAICAFALATASTTATAPEANLFCRVIDLPPGVVQLPLMSSEFH